MKESNNHLDSFGPLKSLIADDEIEEIDMQIEKEKELGIIQDPNAMMMDQGMGGGALPPGQEQPMPTDQAASGEAGPAGGGASAGGLDAEFKNYI